MAVERVPDPLKKDDPMTNFLMTTALATVLSAAVTLPFASVSHAQTATQTDTGTAGMDGFVAPEGYSRFEDRTMLTVESLMGATIYDFSGDTVGDISDLVLATTGAATDSSTTGKMDSTTATDGTATGTMDSTTATDSTATGTTDSTTATDGTATGTDTAAATAGEAAGSQVSLAGGQISHVLIDMGVFLGMGVHTVALPIDALEVYSDNNNDFRIYLPWSEEQLRNLPAYDVNDPATLTPASAASN
jgi:hypothetical protein